MSTEVERASDPTRLIVEACHEPWVEAWSELDLRLARDVKEPLKQGLALHGEAASTAGLGSEPPTSWAERTDRLLEYRRAVGSALLAPLAETLEEPGLTGSIAQLFSDVHERVLANAQSLPTTVTATWPTGALDPRPWEGFGRRIRKLLGRRISAARKAGRERPVPLRSVALDHVANTVAPREDESVAEAMSAWAAWAGRLERAWSEWADTALPSLNRAELPDADDVGELWSAVGEAATSLDERLSALLEEVPHEGPQSGAAERLGAYRPVLEADVAVAGSFLYRNGKASTGALRRVTAATPALEAWDRSVAARLRLYASILAILAGATAVQRRLVERCREESLASEGEILEVASKLRSLLPLTASSRDGDLTKRIADLDAHVTHTLQPALDAIPPPGRVAAALREVADSAVEALLAVIRQAPAGLALHEARQAPPSAGRKVEARTLPLQELARSSFDALRIERVRSSTEGLIRAIGGVRGDLEGLPEVFSFARDEALRELESDEAESEERAIELLDGAVERMAAALETRVEDLNKAIQGAQRRLANEITDGSAALLGRVGAGRMHAQLLAARSRAADLVAWVTDRWGPPTRRAAARARLRIERLKKWTSGLIQKVGAALGREPTAEIPTTGTIQSLATLESLIEGLPLVYQRLFTLDPISDPALLAGREAQLDVAMARWRRWHTGEGVPLLVRGRQRSGITSFLKVFGSTIQAEGHEQVAVTLQERTADEAALARLLSDVLDIEPVRSLDELAHAIFEVDEDSLPGAVTVDNLEHLYMRVPTGTDLMERFLTLMAETEPRVFWIGGVTSSAWQLVMAAEPTAVSQVDVMELPPLDATAVRSAILARHRRSGLDVRYQESVTARARLRRRLRRIRDGKGFRKLLEDEFFDELHRSSGGYLGLGLFLWLQSARFDPDEGVIMSLPQRPDFSVLDQLTLTQNFTLKAFLEHRTLTLEEHDRIFRLPRHQSYQVFESLRNRQLIEDVTPSRDPEASRSDIEVDLRYRVRPLLTGAVVAHLQGRNIVH